MRARHYCRHCGSSCSAYVDAGSFLRAHNRPDGTACLEARCERVENQARYRAWLEEDEEYRERVRAFAGRMNARRVA